MTAETILDQLLAASVSIEAVDGKLLVRPKRLVTPEIDGTIRANKTLLLAWLEQPWDRQAEADALLKEIDGILASVQVPIETPEACKAAKLNLCNDCRDMARSRATSRYLGGVERMVEYARQLKDSIERYCREEVQRRASA